MSPPLWVASVAWWCARYSSKFGRGVLSPVAEHQEHFMCDENVVADSAADGITAVRTVKAGQRAVSGSLVELQPHVQRACTRLTSAGWRMTRWPVGHVTRRRAGRAKQLTARREAMAGEDREAWWPSGLARHKSWSVYTAPNTTSVAAAQGWVSDEWSSLQYNAAVGSSDRRKTSPAPL